LSAISEGYNVSINKILEKDPKIVRIKEIRQVTIYLLRELIHISIPRIGIILGIKNRSYVGKSYFVIANEVGNKDSVIGKRVRDIILKILYPENTSSAEESKKQLEILKIFSKASKIFKETKIEEREWIILKDYRAGRTLQEIGDKFDLSRERIRQIVNKLLRSEANNKEKEGYEIEFDEYLNAAKIIHKNLRVARKTKKKPVKEKRWSRFYIKCRGCGTTITPHVSLGYCERCVGNYRGGAREKEILKLGAACNRCGLSREEARKKYGRDLYLSDFGSGHMLLCRGCFMKAQGDRLGKNHGWGSH